MFLLAEEGKIKPEPDFAVFADTQSEPPWVYENLERLKDRETIPIIEDTAGSLEESIRNACGDEGKFVSVPFWLLGSHGRHAPGRRQCTRTYKIDVIEKVIKKSLGLGHYQHLAHKYKVQQWIGISTDEAHRMKKNPKVWADNRYPLIELDMSRDDCADYIQGRGYPVPKKSACWFCPYRRPSEYARWRTEYPDLFEKAAELDETLRARGPMRGMKKHQYVTTTLQPLRELQVEEEDHDLFGDECDGHCGL